MLDQKQRAQLATRYQLHILTLSPIHIGSGEPDLMLMAGDAVPDGKGRLIVVDLQKLAPPWLTEAELGDLVTGRRSLRDTLQNMEVERLQEIAAYRLPQPEGRAKYIRPHIKTRTNQPYLPGSSLKGAIRTALAQAIYRHEGIQAGVNYVEENGRFKDTEADDTLGAEIFRPAGDEVNYDLLRALQISDSSPVKTLGVAQIAVYSISGNRLSPKPFRLYVETIVPDRQLTATARLDRYLLESPKAREVLRFGVRSSYLEHFISHANDFAEILVNHEIAFFDKYNAPEVLRFYESLRGMLQEARDMGDTCLLYLGWGPGWIAKTLGSALDEETVAQVRNAFDRMGRKGFPIFPKSRRLVVMEGRPFRPLGWLAVSFREIK